MREPPKLNKHQERADGYTPAQEQFIASIDSAKTTLIDRWKRRSGRKGSFVVASPGQRLPAFLDFQVINGKRIDRHG